MSSAADATLRIATLVHLRELSHGLTVARPLAELEHATFGSEADALEELALFLEEHLAGAAPDLLARYALPAATRLVEIDVALARGDLPRSAGFPRPLRLPCALVPHGRDAWVVVLPLTHTIHVSAREDLEEVVRAEVKHLASARELSSWDFEDLLPGGAHRLVPLEVAIPRDASASSSTSRERLAALRRESEAWDLLRRAGSPWEGSSSGGAPLAGRETELAALDALLSGKERRSVLLVGEEGCGKTALLEAWRRRRAESAGDRPPLVVSTSGAQLVAGMSGLGEWQERVRVVLEAAATLDAVLHVESLAELGSDRPGRGADIPSVLRPFLDDRRVRVVTEAAPDVLDLLEARQGPLLASFSRLPVAPLSPAVAMLGLRERVRARRRERPALPDVSDAALEALIDVVERFLPGSVLPGAAVRLLDEVQATLALGEKGLAAVLSAEDVMEGFSRARGVPSVLLRDDRALDPTALARALGDRVTGQEEAVRSVVETLCVTKARLARKGKPLASFLFLGPTGVGKTELARALAAVLFGAEQRMVRLDMSELADPLAADRLVRGAGGSDGLLVRHARRSPFLVLLLDEIEKAHPSVHDLLLPLLGEGRISDARGRTVSLRSTIVVMTSNLGATATSIAGLAPGEVRADAPYRRAVVDAFRPELANRIDRVVVFRSLDDAGRAVVASQAVARVARRRGLEGRALDLEVSDAALAHLAAAAKDPRHGARGVRRAVEDRLATPVARLLCRAGPGLSGGRVRVTSMDEPHSRTAECVEALAAGGLRAELLGGRGAPAALLRGADAISAVRRGTERLVALERVAAVKDRKDAVVAEILAMSAAGRRRSAVARPEMTQALREQDELSRVWSAVEDARGTLHDVEELAFEASLQGEDASGLVGDARAAAREIRRAVYRLLVVERPRRHAATLLVQEIHPGSLAPWLGALAPALESRGIAVAIHVEGGERTGVRWPPLSERRFGPGREPRELGGRGGRAAPRRAILLCARGPEAGALLAPLAGIHRRATAPGENLDLLVRFLGLVPEVPEKGWDAACLVPDSPAELGALRRKPDFELDVARGRYRIAGSEEEPLEVEELAEAFRHLEEIALAVFLRLEADPDRTPDELFIGPLDE